MVQQSVEVVRNPSTITTGYQNALLVEIIWVKLHSVLLICLTFLQIETIRDLELFDEVWVALVPQVFHGLSRQLLDPDTAFLQIKTFIRTERRFLAIFCFVLWPNVVNGFVLPCSWIRIWNVLYGLITYKNFIYWALYTAFVSLSFCLISFISSVWLVSCTIWD